MDGGMKGLHAAIEHLWKLGEAVNGNDTQTRIGKRLGRSPG